MYTQQQSNETHNYEMSIKLHTYKMHTNNFITEHYHFLTNADNANDTTLRGRGEVRRVEALKA